MQPLDFFDQAPLAGFMLVVALGFTLGRWNVRGLALGPAGGTLLVAVTLGALGLDFSHLYVSENQPRLTLGALGFALFIYSVGFEAGPRFFGALADRQGWRLVAIGILANLLALGIAVALGRAFGFTESMAAGVLAGALTSAPTYAAAVEVSGDTHSLAVVFALTYPIGLVGLVALTQVLPRWMGDDLQTAAPDADTDEAERATVLRPVLRRAFEVRQSDAVGRSLAELDLPATTGCRVVQIHRGSEVMPPSAATRLQETDHVMAAGRLEQLTAFEARIGPEVYDAELRKRLPSPRAVVVNQPQAVGKTLRELPVLRRYHCLVTAVRRQDVSIEASADLRLERDDVALIVGRAEDVRAVSRHLGEFERSTRETDLAVYSGGIVIGLGCGFLAKLFLYIDAYAVGLLAAGIVLGRFRRIGPWSAHVPAAARQLVRDLGILLFIAETGVAAGGQSFDSVQDRIPELLAAAAVVLLVSVVGTILVGRLLLRLGPIESWGSAAGSMTSSSALAALRRATESSELAVAYAASYAIGAVFATLSGRWVVTLVGM
ncbi:MAG: hypothetical protein MPN21_00220 [Thermoanaerobaculia bacterium]|nr:hypothetical protein [Thermoanaerobaculia bacterium]